MQMWNRDLLYAILYAPNEEKSKHGNYSGGRDFIDTYLIWKERTKELSATNSDIMGLSEITVGSALFTGRYDPKRLADSFSGL